MKTVELQPGEEWCDGCEGTGIVYMSCCGDDIRGSDMWICPSCGEHQGDEGESCEECSGEGKIKTTNTDSK
jgi:hypothetical protein